jgi:hypothetical protein
MHAVLPQPGGPCNKMKEDVRCLLAQHDITISVADLLSGMLIYELASAIFKTFESGSISMTFLAIST